MLSGIQFMNALSACTVAPDQFAFSWLGQMGLIVKTASLTMCFDPFLTDQPDRIFPSLLQPEELSTIDFVFGSHDHSDHIDRLAWPAIAAAAPKARFVVPALLAEGLAKDLKLPKERFIPVDLDYGYESDTICIRGIPSAHEKLEPDFATGLYPCMGYMVATPDGSFYHPGDCCLYDGLEARLKALGPIDLMILPVNGRDGRRLRKGCIGNMTYQEAADLAGAVNPGLVIPGHYETIQDNGSGADAMAFIEMLEAKYPRQRFCLPPHGEVMRYSREGLMQLYAPDIERSIN